MLYEPGERIQHVYFPNDAHVSLLDGLVPFQQFAGNPVSSTCPDYRRQASPVPTCASMMMRTCEPWLERDKPPKFSETSWNGTDR
jgi:hypothetical protein